MGKEAKKKCGRKSKYDLNVKPYLEKIREWKKVGATDRKICEVLGISKTSYYEYLQKYPDFSDSLKKGTSEFCFDLRGELAKLSKKHTLETKKQYIKVDQETGNKTQYTEITTKEVDADPAAIHLLLKNLDKENWANDPQNHLLKQQELELRKAIAKSQNFDLELEEDKQEEK